MRFNRFIIGYFGALGCIAASTWAVAASAADLEMDPSQWITLMPELKDAPPPTWVKPGLQMAYSFASATIRGSYKTYSPDPNGNFVDPQGNHYSASDTATASAHGVMVSDVVGVEGNRVIAQVTTSLFMPAGALAPSGSASAVVYGGATEAWLGPVALKRVLTLNGPGMKAYRAPYALENKTYQAVWITFASGKSSEYWIYDEVSGTLLRAGSASEGAAPAVVGPEGGGPSTLLTLTTYASARMLTLPWSNAQPPAWASNFRVLHYRGGQTVTVQGSPTVTPFPLDVSLTPGRSGQGWTEIMMKSRMQGLQGFAPVEGEAKSASGATNLLGAYVPPEGLKNLQKGQVLDRDPATNYTYTVLGQARGPKGPMMVIRQAGKIFTSDVGYDLQTGMMVSINKEDHSTEPGITRTQLQFVGKE